MTPPPPNMPMNVTYASNLSCSSCTLGGYTYCISGSPNQVVTTYPASPAASFCCMNSTNCSYVNTTTWSCTNSYADPGYALYVCPISSTVCGSKQQVKFTKIGNATNITIAGLPMGQTCLYRVDA